ncbi:MAG: thioredoxin domain-containing protein [Halarcobacter sp.]
MKKILIILLFGFGSLFAFEHLTTENFDKKIEGKNVIIDFYATWCPPCKILAKNLIKFDKVKPSNVKIFKVDIDQYMNLAKKYNIRSLPTLAYFKDGKLVTKEVGIVDEQKLMLNSINYFR